MNISGPKLDKIVQLSVEWYVNTRQKLIAALEEGHPYGAVKVTPAEQYDSYVSMMPEDWDALIAELENRYRGLPNQRDLVDKDLARYVNRMAQVGAGLRSGGSYASLP